MTADGYYVEAADAHFRAEAMAWQDWQASSREWQERHADLAASLRTVLAMCAHTEQHHPGGPAHLARSIRGVIEQATEWPGR